MLLKAEDIDAFVDRYSDFQLEERRAGSIDEAIDATASFISWLNNNPQVLMPSGMRDYVSAQAIPQYAGEILGTILEEYSRPAFRLFKGSWFLPSGVSSNPDHSWESFEIGELYSESLDVDGMPPLLALPSANEVIRKAESFIDSPYNDITTFTCSRIWTPDVQERQRLLIQDSASKILAELQSQKIELFDLHWKSLEEIVVELFRSRGLEVYHVQDSPQGGRDVILRGSLAKGFDPITLAVEVKHRRLVDRPEIQQAFAQNAHFNGLLFVTSGRFTAGVIKEAKKPENQMRLLLKDGVSIGEMIKSYRVNG